MENSKRIRKLQAQPGEMTFGKLMTSPIKAENSGEKFVNPEQPGYVGFANLPNQVHRKSVKKGFEFTLMVVGESGLGKSTLVNSLFLTDLYPERHIPSAAEKIQQTVKIDASTVEIEERGVKLRLTVVDTPGFGDSLNSQDCFRPIIQYVDDQFERYLQDESGLNRRHIVDNRVHSCFYFINPSGHGLKPLDISFMRALHHKVNIVPVIAKADTLTKQEVLTLKRRILDQIDENGINIYPLPDCDSDEDEDYKEQCRQLKQAVPFAVVGANTIIEVKGRKVRGRMYPWGVVEVENPEHCDFIKLRTMLITHMQDLQEVTQEIHYENFRAERLATGGAQKRVKYVCMAFGCSPHLVKSGCHLGWLHDHKQHYLENICLPPFTNNCLEYKENHSKAIQYGKEIWMLKSLVLLLFCSFVFHCNLTNVSFQKILMIVKIILVYFNRTVSALGLYWMKGLS